MKNYFVFIIAFIVCTIDQIVKYIVLTNLYFAENVPIIKDYLSITKVFNTGAAFSLFENSTKLLVIFSFLVSVIIIIYIIKKKTVMEYPLVLAWGLILGGTVGNLIDRLFNGFVVDFIKLDFFKFPIFNIADISINIGAFIIVIYSILKLRKQVQSD